MILLAGDKYHPASVVEAGMTAALGVAVPDSLLSLEGQSLDGVDVLVVAKSNARSPEITDPWLTPDLDAALHRYVDGGGLLLVIHSGTVGYPVGTAMRTMTGGAFLRHPEQCEVELVPLAGESFTVWDEHYFVESDPGLDVFLVSRSASGEQAAGWTKSVGQGRVYVLTPGHTESCWASPGFQGLVRHALHWATGP